ncbi:MAG: hypothetical protein DI640_13020 [Sphingomonas taxi]|uniref:PD-(D/E)XK endonuclease-like domain-containing protein n=1 Tax=Sphingomonas taxi TaxID=1549858 RepID=A0A2W4YXQ2_9SPHN|nr:MAG: hypothetical protein DI640_13020 [Sphingomonas taxi]
MNDVAPAWMPMSWSHSRLQTYKVCPKQFYHMYVAKDVRDDGPKHPTTVWGEEVHKAIEYYINADIPLPPNMQQYAPWATLAKQLPNARAEVRLGVSVSWQPTEFFAPDVWGRCIVDVYSVDGNEAAAVDWKLGKYRGDTGQAAVNAVMMFAANPEVTKVTTQFIYLAARKVDTQHFVRDKLAEYVEPTIDVIRQIETCRANDAWHPTPSGLCGYCPVTRCQFNKRR